MPKKEDSVVGYIRSMLYQGHPIQHIQVELAKAGHHKRDIHKACKAAMKPKKSANKGESNAAAKVFSGFYILFLVVFIFFIAFATRADPIIVAVSFLPVLLSVIFFIPYLDCNPSRWLLFGLPLLLSAVFMLIVDNGIVGFLSQVDYVGVGIMNMVLGLFFALIILLFLGRISPKPLEREEKPEAIIKKEAVVKEAPKEAHHEPPKDIKTYIQSIEDKAKALNFAIGRVYSKKHGAKPELRKSLQVDRQWYNKVSGMEANPAELRLLIQKIVAKLHTLAKTEAELLGGSHNSLKNIERSPDGMDRVIDVVIRNDKDPVKAYYDSAIEFCSKLLQELNNAG